ncbi:MAG: conjugal transfer protein TraF, partial [Gallionella sp.]|nr:conjugal transfer protein TraF [Gallionella sp.]
MRILVASALLASSSAALAVPFNSFDPRSMAMGGAGVAVGDAGNAPFFNPALLNVAGDKDNFSLNLPVIGARLYAPAEFMDFKDGDYISKLQSSIDAYNAVQNSTNLTAVSGNISTLSNQLTIISDKPVQIEAGAGVVVGIPSKSFGGAFYATGWAAMGGEIKYRDNQNLQDFVTASNTVTTVINSAACGGTVNSSAGCVAALAPLATDPLVPQYFTVSAAGVTSSFNTNNNLQSKVDIRGVTMGEMGFAFAKQ